MILFLFEGLKREPAILETIKTLFFSPDTEETIIVSYCNNIYQLYSDLIKEDSFGDDIDIETFINFLKLDLRKRNITNSPIQDIEYVDEISQVFLFFDYDGHNKNLSRTQINQQLESMLNFFDNESRHGKLYISYPMIESLYDTYKYKDQDFNNRVITIEEGSNFKSKLSNYECLTYDEKLIRHTLGSYKDTDTDFLSFMQKQLEARKQNVLENWKLIIKLTIQKVLYICSETDLSKTNQSIIFKNQLNKYILTNNSIAVLNSFPIFLKEYFIDL